MVVETKDPQKLMAICTDIISKTHDWVWEIDEDGFFTFCSESVQGFLGYSPQEFYKKNLYEFYPPEMIEKLNPILNMKTKFQHKNGKIIIQR